MTTINLGENAMQDNHKCRTEQLFMAEWNDANTAFVKCDRVSHNDVWRLFAADGKELAVTDSKALAFIVARQNNIEAYSVN